MKLMTLARSLGRWLDGTGPSSDIVLSTRVRLARNMMPALAQALVLVRLLTKTSAVPSPVISPVFEKRKLSEVSQMSPPPDFMVSTRKPGCTI